MPARRRTKSDVYQVDLVAALFGGFMVVWLSTADEAPFPAPPAPRIAVAALEMSLNVSGSAAALPALSNDAARRPCLSNEVRKLLPDRLAAHLVACSRTTVSTNEPWTIMVSPFTLNLQDFYMFTDEWAEDMLKSANMIQRSFVHLVNIRVISAGVHPVGSAALPTDLFKIPVTRLSGSVSIARCATPPDCQQRTVISRSPNATLGEMSFFTADNFDEISERRFILVRIDRLAPNTISQHVYLGESAPNDNPYYAWVGNTVPVPGPNPRLRRIATASLPSNQTAHIRFCFFSLGEEACFRNLTPTPLGAEVRLERE